MARRNLPRDITGASADVSLASGEILFDASINRFRGGDGGTTGGLIQAAQDDLVPIATNASNALKTRTYLTVSRNSSHQADYICDGVADDVQIQAAINAVAAAGGGVVFLRANFNPYRISVPIEMAENVELRGEKLTRNASYGVLLKTSAGVTLDAILTMTGADGALKRNIRVAHIALDGNLTTTWCFKGTNSDYVKFYDCRFINSTNGLASIYSGAAAPITSTIPGGLYLATCNVSSRGGVGVRLEYQTQCWMSDIWFTTGSTTTYWLDFLSSDKVKVTNSEFNTATGAAIRLSDVSTGGAMDYSSQYILVTGCAFANGSDILEDNRTHPNSNRVQITGTSSGATDLGDRPVGNSDVVMTSTDTILPAITWIHPLWMGGFALWIDGSGRLRIMSGAPASDGDGTIVGTQS